MVQNDYSYNLGISWQLGIRATSEYASSHWIKYKALVILEVAVLRPDTILPGMQFISLCGTTTITNKLIGCILV